jgi:hypothetical protein
MFHLNKLSNIHLNLSQSIKLYSQCSAIYLKADALQLSINIVFPFLDEYTPAYINIPNTLSYNYCHSLVLTLKIIMACLQSYLIYPGMPCVFLYKLLISWHHLLFPHILFVLWYVMKKAATYTCIACILWG